MESAVSSESCGAVISDESPMFVVATREGDRLRTSLCDGNRPITNLDGPPQVPGRAPTPPAGQRPPQPTGAGQAVAPQAQTGCENGAPDCGGANGTLVGLLAAGAALAVAASAGGVWLARRRARPQ